MEIAAAAREINIAVTCRRLVQWIPLALLFLGVLCPPTAAEQPRPVELADSLHAILERVAAADTSIPGLILHVHAPQIKFTYDGAVGTTRFEGGEPLTPEHPVRLASNTKTYVAAAVLRLWEDGFIDLESTLHDHLPTTYLQLLVDGGYAPATITIRHLLTHTSGLFDYATSEVYTEHILRDPMHRWSRIEQLRGAVDWGEPYAAPGEIFHYSDTGYILLGLIVEQQTGKDLAQSLRELIDFSRLGLDHTWMESLEDQPAETRERAHQYYGDIDIYPFDPSFDLYGGGGLVSTMADLSLFMRALFKGRVFRDDTTIDLMLRTAQADTSSHNSYRMGLSAIELAGHIAYGHEGFWGTAAVYIPDLDIAIATSLNQGESDQLWRVVEEAVAAVKTVIGNPKQ